MICATTNNGYAQYGINLMNNHDRIWNLIKSVQVVILVALLFSPFSSTAAQQNYFIIPGPLEIVACDFSSNDGATWALGMDFDPSAKKQESKYSIVRFSIDGRMKKYTTDIPVGTIVTPYRAKNQVRFFRLLRNRYLHVGIKHLDGSIYFLTFDTRHPNGNHETMTMRLKGNVESANVFLAKNGSRYFVGSESGLPYMVIMSADKKILVEKKGLGLDDPGKLKQAALLADGQLLLTFNKYRNADTGTGLLVMLDKTGRVKDKKKIDGIVVDAMQTGKNTTLILIAHDQGGQDMEAQALDIQLNVISRYPVDKYFRIKDAAGQLFPLNGTDLLSASIERNVASNALVHIKAYSRSGNHELAIVSNPNPGRLRAYNVSAQVLNNTIYTGTAAIAISGPNKGQKAYFLHSFPVN